MKKEFFIFGGLVVVVLIGVILYVSKKSVVPTTELTANPIVESVSASPVVNTALANPASQNCAKLGGQSLIQKRGDGGEYGLCQFEDNMACEEWALFRGECPVGGRKTTGYDNVQQSYCVWLGGQTLAEPNAQCTLPNGKVCPVDQLYNGKCS